MKVIVAYIQPDRLNPVKESLFKAGVFKMSVIPNAMGCGQQKGYTEAYRGHVTEVTLRLKTRIEIAVNDEFVKPTIDAIIEGAPRARSATEKSSSRISKSASAFAPVTLGVMRSGKLMCLLARLSLGSPRSKDRSFLPGKSVLLQPLPRHGWHLPGR